MSEGRDRLERVFCAGWSLLLAVGLLGPALAPGFVLTYDMVWVPDLALRPDFLGLASGLPRAVPSDAVVAVLDEVLPGSLLQKLVLAGCLMAGGIGAARLAPWSLPARMAAVSLYQWNALVVERLVIGHWPVLIAYAGLPWLIVLAARWRREGRMPWALWFLVPLGSLSASAGLVMAAVLVATAAGRGRTRAVAVVMAAANAPWVITGILHAGIASTDPAGASVFALHDEGPVPGPIAALTLGGIWNSEVVPTSRAGVLGWVTLAIVALLAWVGARPWWQRTASRDRGALIACWGVGWGLATLTWSAPGFVGSLGEHVSGLGLLRDGSRVLVLCAPLVVTLVAHGVAALYDRVAATGVAAGAVAVAAALLPIALLPDVAWGAGGSLRAVDYPTSYDAARSRVAVAVADGQRGDVLVLPLSSYRQPAWNDGHKVLDPLGRYLTPDFVASDVLVVSGTVVAGEDPRVADAGRALAAPTPEARAEQLAALGIGFVAVEPDAPEAGTVPTVTADEVIDTGEVWIGALDNPRPREVTPWEFTVVAVAWLAYVATFLAGALGAARSRSRAANLCRE